VRDNGFCSQSEVSRPLCLSQPAQRVTRRSQGRDDLLIQSPPCVQAGMAPDIVGSPPGRGCRRTAKSSCGKKSSRHSPSAAGGKSGFPAVLRTARRSVPATSSADGTAERACYQFCGRHDGACLLPVLRTARRSVPATSSADGTAERACYQFCGRHGGAYLLPVLRTARRSVPATLQFPRWRMAVTWQRSSDCLRPHSTIGYRFRGTARAIRYGEIGGLAPSR